MHSSLTFICLFLATQTAANKVHIKTATEDFYQEDHIDKKSGCIYRKTPSHHGRDAVRTITCPHQRIQAAIWHHPKQKKEVCMVSQEASLGSASKELRDELILQFKGDLPNKKGAVKTEGCIRLLRPLPHGIQLPDKIFEFCGDLEMMGSECEKSLHDAADDALAIHNDPELDDNKRAIVRQFMTCDKKSAAVLHECPNPTCVCKLQGKYCTYMLSCDMSLSYGGLDCDARHVLDSPVCCDFTCPS